MMTGEAEATKLIIFPSCAGYLRKWNLTTKNCCCTWPKKLQGTSHEQPTDSTTSGRFVERQPGLFLSQARQPPLQNCLARWLNCGEGDPHSGVRLGMDHLA